MPSIKDVFPAQVGVNSIVTTKGDLLVRDSTTTVRLGVGTDGYYLIADSAAAEGVSWQGVSPAFSTVNAQFTQPAVGNTVLVTLTTNSWIFTDMYVFVQTGGVYYVVSKTGPNQVTLRNEYDSNQTPGQVITIANAVVPAGQRGNDGTSSFADTTLGFNVPSVGANVLVPFDNVDWLIPNQIIYVEDAGYYQVVSINNNDVTMQNLGYAGNAVPTTSITVARLVVPAGLKGQDGDDPYTTTTANFTQPAVNNTVDVSLANDQWLAVGQHIYITGGGSYEVINASGPTTLENTGAAGNAAPATVINSGAFVASSGLTGPAGTNAVAFNLAANFTQPAVSSTVSITVDTTEFSVAGAYIYIPTGGFYKIDSITDLTTMVIENIGDGDNAPVSNNIFQPQKIVAAARPGTDGTNGTNGTDGATWYSKAGAPTDGEFSESVGDFCYDFTNNDIYEKTDGTTWTLRANINGVDGNDGADGATGSVSAAASLSLDHQVSDPTQVVDKLILYSKSDGLYHIQPDATVRKVVEEDDLGTAAAEDVGTAVNNVVQIIDIGGNPGLPVLDGSNLTGLSAEFDNNLTIVPSSAGSLPSGQSGIAQVASPKLAVLKSIETDFDSDVEIFSVNEAETGTTNPNVKLMLNFNGTNGDTTTVDSSSVPKTVTLAGAAQLSNVQQRLATTTLSLSGAIGTFATVPFDSDFDFGTGDYTIEGFFYCTTFNTSSSLVSNCILSTDFYFGGNASGQPRKFSIVGDSGQVYSTAEASLNTWTHFAVVRISGVAKLYIDGVEVISTAHTNSYQLESAGSTVYIGTLASQLLDGGRTFTGFVEDLRVTKGEGLYVAPFPPPTIEISEDLRIRFNSIKKYTGLLANTKLDVNLIVYNESNTLNDLKFEVTNNDAGTQTIALTAELIEIRPAFSSGAGGGSITVQNEGTSLPDEDTINFIGDLVDATNNAGNGSNDITIDSQLSALGDLMYYGSSGLTNLPRGTQGQILSSDDTAGLVWVAAPADLDVATTKGDIIVYNGTAYVRVAVGADGQSLLADSAEASGVKWGTVGGGGDMLKSVYDPGDNGIVDEAENITGTPGNDKYYGTNASGTKGFYDLPSGGTGGGADLSQIYAVVTAAITI